MSSTAVLVLESLLLQTVILLDFGWSLKQVSHYGTSVIPFKWLIVGEYSGLGIERKRFVYCSKVL